MLLAVVSIVMLVPLRGAARSLRDDPTQEVLCRQKRSSTLSKSIWVKYVGGTRGLAWQAPYKGDLFKLFLQAYKQGYVQSTGPAPLTGSAIRDELIARYQPQNPSQEQIEFLDQIVILWDAWSYALDRYQEGA